MQGGPIYRLAVMLTIYPAHSDEYIADVRTLFVEYAEELGEDLCFQSFDAELAALPGMYAPPDGAVLLAAWEGDVAGVVGLRRLDAQACEMKRMYVRPAFRGKRIGRALAEAILDEARQRGYAQMRLDTLARLQRARTLYAALGFEETAPYYANPLEGVHYMVCDLREGRQ